MVTDTPEPRDEPAPISAEAILRFPDDGWRYELVRGKLVRMPPTGYDHGRITPLLLSRLLQFVEDHRLGVVCGTETGFLLSREGEPDTVLAPDAAFIAAARAPEGSVPGFPRLAPDLVCEVASPTRRGHRWLPRRSSTSTPECAWCG
jgi:Uma2 family endonuclease